MSPAAWLSARFRAFDFPRAGSKRYLTAVKRPAGKARSSSSAPARATFSTSTSSTDKSSGTKTAPKERRVSWSAGVRPEVAMMMLMNGTGSNLIRAPLPPMRLRVFDGREFRPKAYWLEYF